MRIFLIFFSCFFFLLSCSEEAPKTTSKGELRVYLPRDPEKLNPLFNPKSYAREVYQNIYVPMVDYHPEDLDLYPILLEDVPEGQMINDSTLRFDMKIKKDAVWSDGVAVTGADYAFSIKTILHPQINTPTWRSLVSYIRDVGIDPNDPKHFWVDISNENMLAREIATTIYILPKHFYDPTHSLDDYSIADVEATNIEEKTAADSLLISFVEAFNNPKTYRENLIHAGPYELESWETDQFVKLAKKKDYWGDAHSDNPFLQGYPESILFKIFADELSATTNFQSGGMDVMKFATAERFISLMDTTDSNENYSFETPQLMRYYYLALNTRKPGLQDKAVRKAVAMALDVDGIVAALEAQFGARTTGPIHPSKPYYNNELEPIKKDIGKAQKLLDDAGWRLNESGVRSKDGIELSFEFLSSPSEKAVGIANLFKEACRELGVEINIVQKSPRLFIKEDVNTHKYDIAALAQTLDANLDDLHYRWHTSNSVAGGSNITGFGTSASDKLIEEIRSNISDESRFSKYKKVQEILFDEQPAIFLYSPRDKIVIKKPWTGKGTSKRPGYLLNTFSLND